MPVTDKIISNRESGAFIVREALDQPRLWVVDLGFDGAVAEAWFVSPKDVPDDAQLQPGTMLHRDHDPRLGLRAI